MRADPSVLVEEQAHNWGNANFPIHYAAYKRQPEIALWLIANRGEADVDAPDRNGMTALHSAAEEGPLSVVLALVEAGANPLAVPRWNATTLTFAAERSHADITTYLLQLPGVRAIINKTSTCGEQRTALSTAAKYGHLSLVRLLLDAGADPTIPEGHYSPLNQATVQFLLHSGLVTSQEKFRHHSIITHLLCRTIAEPDRARTLHKARALTNAAASIRKARFDARDRGEPSSAQQESALAAAPQYQYLSGRVERSAPLPRVELTPRQGDERLRATMAFVVGLEEGGVEYAGLHGETYKKLLAYMIHPWADKGPEA